MIIPRIGFISITLSLLLSCFLMVIAGSPARSAGTAPRNLWTPGNVALVQTDNDWRYVHFPSNLRLYVFDGDAPNKSNCNEGCWGAWQPLSVTGNETPGGDWTIFARDDGTKQWAYKGRPVYSRFHDSVQEPIGNGIDGNWHFVEP